MPDDAQQLPTLSEADRAALQTWVRQQNLGSDVTDVAPLTGGTQNIVVRVHIDGRPMVLRRPPLHPRPTSDKTMLREIAALRTLAGTDVPHPGFIAGSEVAEAYVRDETMRHDVGLSYAASLARLGNAAWEGKPLAELRRPGSFVERQVSQFLRLLESYRHDRYNPESLAVTDLADWLQANLPPDSEPGVMHGDPHLSNVLLRRDKPELAAFVDWEMCTVGDPLLDLGWMLITWPLNTSTITAGGALAAVGGLASRQELLEAYWIAGGRETSNLDWYMAMACFKLGVVIEGTWSRYLMGKASRDAGEALHANAQHLIDIGTRVVKGDNPFELT